MIVTVVTLEWSSPGSQVKEPSVFKTRTPVAAITGEGKWALSWAEFMADTAPKVNDDDYRGRLMSLAVAYDWLYPRALFRAVAPKGARITVVRSRGR